MLSIIPFFLFWLLFFFLFLIYSPFVYDFDESFFFPFLETETIMVHTTIKTRPARAQIAQNGDRYAENGRSDPGIQAG